MKKFISVFLLLSLFMLTGCGDQVKAVKKISQVVMDPDIPIGDDSDQASIVKLHIYATANVNPNLNNMASPVQLMIYQLKSPHVFLSSDYYSLIEDPKETLKTTYISHEEYEINPDTWMPIQEIEVKKDTMSIAVVGMYSDVDLTQWRAAMPIKSSTGEKYDFLVMAERNKIRIVEYDPSKIKDSKAIRDAEKELKRQKQDHHYEPPQPPLKENIVHSVKQPKN